MRRAWIAFTVALILVLPARIYVMGKSLDMKTGFYADGGAAIGIVSAVLAVGMLACALFSLRDADTAADLSGRPVRNAAAAAVGALAGLFVLLESVVGFSTSFGAENQILYWIFCAAGLPAGIVILAVAYCFASGSDLLKRHPLVALLPSVWGCLFLALLFVTYASQVNLVENAYTTFTVIFLLLFLFTQAKLITGIESQKSFKRIFAVGFPAALIAFATALPECFWEFSGRGTTGSLPTGLSLIFVVLAAYILVFLAAQWRAAQTASLRFAGDFSEDEAEQVPQPSAAPQNEAGVTKASDATSVSAPQGSFTEANMLECAEFLQNTYRGSEKFETRAASPFFRVQESDGMEC